MSQYLLNSFSTNTAHGGEHSVGKRKTARPICTKRAIHVVLRSTMARGRMSLLQPGNAKFVREAMHDTSRDCGVRVYEFANVGNHLHLLVRTKTRRGFQTFLRRLAGLVALRVSGAIKGKPLPRRFWDLPAFTRIVAWGRAFAAARKYVVQNTLEALGVVAYRERKGSGRGGRKPLCDTGG